MKATLFNPLKPVDPVSFFEDCTGHDELHFQETELSDDNGDTRVEMRAIIRKSNVPFTPQSGIETKLQDLSFIMKTNQKVNHEPAYLSIARTGNPFDGLKAFGTAVQNMQNEKQKEEKTKK